MDAPHTPPPGPESHGSTQEESRSSDAGPWPRVQFSARAACEAACAVRQEVEDAVMTFLPPTVTQHLVNAQKEVIRAGMRLGEVAMEKLDRKADRARDLHPKAHRSESA